METHSLSNISINHDTMTLTFNAEKYQELLSEYQPKLIQTEAENERVLIQIEQLMNTPDRSLEQDAIYELLITLVKKFEQEFYQPNTENTPASILSFLMEQQDLKPIDLVGIFGSESAIQDVLSGKMKIGETIAQQLGKLFSVDASLFG